MNKVVEPEDEEEEEEEEVCLFSHIVHWLAFCKCYL
jgi:hypothetical protein